MVPTKVQTSEFQIPSPKLCYCAIERLAYLCEKKLNEAIHEDNTIASCYASKFQLL